jgi:hypothetical protein
MNFKIKVNSVFDKINNWFQANLLSLNFDKTKFLQFLTKNSRKIDIQVGYENRQIASTYNIEFLRLSMDGSLSWKNHIVQLISKLSKSRYVIRLIKPFLYLKTIGMVYFSYIHSLLTYGIIVWRNSSHVKSGFKIQKIIISIITDSRSKDSSRDLFKSLNILPLKSQYIYSISVFIVMNRGLFKSNYDIHNIPTRQKVDLHMSSSKLTLFHYTGCKILNHLPSYIKELSKDVKEL